MTGAFTEVSMNVVSTIRMILNHRCMKIASGGWQGMMFGNYYHLCRNFSKDLILALVPKFFHFAKAPLTIFYAW